MSLSLAISNFSKNNILENASAAKDATSGQPVLIVDNGQNILANDYLLIGKPGGRVSRIYKVQAITGETVTLTSNLEFYVERGTDVTKLFGNKLKIYTAPYVQGQIPTVGNFTALSGGLIDIDPDQNATNFIDYNGSNQIWYRNTYYNDVSLTETSLADSTSMRDDRDSHYASIDDIREEAGFKNNSNVGDDLIDRKRRAAEAKINGMLAGRYVLPFAQPINAQIADLTTRLAAGYVMIAEYGTFDGADKTKGEKLRDDAIKELEAIQSGSVVVTDLQAIDTTLPDAGGFSYGVNADSTPRMFSTGDIQGYYGRGY